MGEIQSQQHTSVSLETKLDKPMLILITKRNSKIYILYHKKSTQATRETQYKDYSFRDVSDPNMT
ncbi:hypothetical protein YC2023_124158 [Brassica napus]